MKTLSKTRLSKKDREKRVLFGLVEEYLTHFQPVGSKTLKESAFEDLSSATIRNYFAALEHEGYLSQQHASGGRIPTEKAYKAYAEEFLRAGTLEVEKDKRLKQGLSKSEEKEVAEYLQRAAEVLSEVSGLPALISSPRFDHDSIVDIKLVGVGSYRCLCVIITELGLIRTETLYLDEKLNLHALKRVEESLLSRVKGHEIKTSLDKKEDAVARKIYNEVMVRYIIGYANFSVEDIYSTGLSRLLGYPEFNNADAFAGGLSLFENENNLRRILRDSCQDKNLKYYIGEDLNSYCPIAKGCSVLVLPYQINGKVVGAAALLGPFRIPYKNLFGILRAFTEYVSLALNKSIEKYELTFRLPEVGQLYLDQQGQSSPKLLENQSE